MPFKLKNAFCFCLVVFTFSACDSDLIQPVSTVNLDNRLKLLMREGIELMGDLEGGSKDLTFVESYSRRVRELLNNNVYIFYIPGRDALESVKACKDKVHSVNNGELAAQGKLEVLDHLLDRFISTYDKDGM